MKHRSSAPPPPAPPPAGDTAINPLQEYATELAQEDGRTEARAEDRAVARRERTAPASDSAPEVPAGDETLVTWDTSPDEAGHRTPEAVADDESDMPAVSAEEGSGEAEQDLRRATNAQGRTHRHWAPSLE